MRTGVLLKHVKTKTNSRTAGSLANSVTGIVCVTIWAQGGFGEKKKSYRPNHMWEGVTCGQINTQERSPQGGKSTMAASVGNNLNESLGTFGLGSVCHRGAIASRPLGKEGLMA